MKRLNKIGLSLAALFLIAPAAVAAPVANGAYASKYPDSLRIELKGSRYRVVSVDFEDEGWRSRSETKFKHIKLGVFYNLTDKTYYCSVALLSSQQQQNTDRQYICSKNGWKIF